MTRQLGALLALAVPLLAQSHTPEQIAQVFDAYQHPDTPGCAVGVEAPERDPWTAAYGMADLEHGVQNTPATVFEVGSVSKQFTAAATLLLVERGRISLDDDIRKYFPELPEYERSITVRQLLNHTSGLRDWGDVSSIAGWPRTTRAYTHAHVLEILSRQRSLNYAPGDAWSYTNSGYNLAAMLVERVSGMTLQAFCRKEFFEPLGMTSTEWRDDFRKVVRGRAIAYASEGSEWRQDMPFENVYGNGGLLSTVGDLLKWNRNITNGTLDPSIFQIMQKRGSLTGGQPIGYGFGFFLQDFQGLEEISHSGATAGYRAWLGRIPSKRLSIAVICNAASANPTGYGYQIARLYLGIPNPDPPAPPAEFTPGLYRNARDHSIVKVDRKDGALTLDGQPARSKVRFAGGKMILTDPTFGDNVWERVEQWTPANPAEFTGVYSSEEAETTLRVALEKGNLVVHRRPADSFTLKPTYTDAFESPLGGGHFLRDAGGKVVTFSLSRSRVWDIRFARESAGANAGFTTATSHPVQ